jgi:hypothetical protein
MNIVPPPSTTLGSGRFSATALLGLLVLLPLPARAQVTAPTADCAEASGASALARFTATVSHGIQEFDRSTVFVVPDGVTSIVVELWGAGGGGGGGSADAYTTGGSGGGGGASGAYVRAVVAVSAGKAYTLAVGKGGAGGLAEGRARAMAGLDGGPSSLCDGNANLVSAHGGAGGKGSPHYGKRGVGGAGLTTEPSLSAIPSLRRGGNDGSPGQDALFERAGSGGIGGVPVLGSVGPAGSFGGNGGAGGSMPDYAQDGKRGGAGSIIVSW